MAYGTLSTLDTLAAIRQSVVDFGEDQAWNSIGAALDAHNAQVAEMLGSLVERTTDARRSYGTTDAKVMDEMDQWGLPDAQKVTAGVTVDFPLRRYGSSLQWTYQWMRSNTVAQLAAEVAAIMDSDRLNFQRQVKRAIFLPTNTTFVDKLGNPANVTLNLKAFVNADSAGIPVGPNGETFSGATHTHYLANATLTTAAATSLITTVQEHYNTGIPRVYIATADEAAWRALTGFQAYIDPRLTLNANANQPTARGELSNLYNRPIGIYGNAEIWIKPWMIANYAFSFIPEQPAAVAMRVPTFAGLGDLNLVMEDERYPLRARSYERQFGMSIWNRTNGAVLYFAGGAYVAPTV
jgi:hypothetical protein